MGLPIHIWSEDTFNRIANGIDGSLVYVKEIGADFLSFQVHPDEDPKPNCSCSGCELPGTIEVVDIPSETNRQEDSVSTWSIIDDRCLEEIIKETQLKLREEHFDIATHDNHSTFEKTLPPGFEDFNRRKIGMDAVTRSDMVKRHIDNEENEETEDIEVDAEESVTCDDEDEEIEEAKMTLQVCEKAGITYNEDKDVVLTKMTNKKKNNRKRRLKKM
ncbi:hypothetical protein PIB30_076098 [Stylosanthes scabra]|uniref:DUF4283 domain-containing protein n=1 Tax=Stylosanthes scabra TaxID=79078 RepID=A0ABU6WNH8_9FABA|nr:hypothetical protein [Stylosanthes scabra]